MQILKEDIQTSIEQAALSVFATNGFDLTTMAMVAKKAGISVGNIYRYFPSKNQLFAFVLPKTFATDVSDQLDGLLELASQAGDLKSHSPEGKKYAQKMQNVIASSFENRHRLFILFERAQGTEFEGFKQRTIHQLVKGAKTYSKKWSRGEINPGTEQVLAAIYESFLTICLRFYLEAENPQEAQNLLDGYLRYHQTGLKTILIGGSH